MAISCQYISDADFQLILADLNIEGMSGSQLQDLIDRAAGDLESELCVRFAVPLVPVSGGDYNTTPSFAQRKVKNAIRAKIRSTIASDKNRNTTFEQGQTFKNTHEDEFKAHCKTLIDPTRVFGFLLVGQSQGSMEPVQSLGLARPNDHTKVVVDEDVPFP